MTLLLGLLLTPAFGAPDSKTCSAAFAHMTKVSIDELDTLPPAQRKMALDAMKKTDDKAREATFVKACTAGMFDTACIMKSKDTMGYMQCLKPPAPKDVECKATDLRAAAKAIHSVSPDQRVPMAAMALAEACSWPAGIEEALSAIGNMGPDRWAVMDMRAAAESADLWLALDCPKGTACRRRGRSRTQRADSAHALRHLRPKLEKYLQT